MVNMQVQTIALPANARQPARRQLMRRLMEALRDRTGAGLLDPNKDCPYPLEHVRYARSLNAGRNLTKVECSGVVRKMDVRFADARQTTTVLEGKFGYADANVKGSELLVTYELITCVAIIAHNPSQGVGFMAHMNNGWDAIRALDIVINTINPSNIILYGGDNYRDYSVETVRALEGALALSYPEVQVSGRDTLRGREKRPDFPRIKSQAKHSAIGFDVRDGSVWLPHDVVTMRTENTYSCTDLTIREPEQAGR